MPGTRTSELKKGATCKTTFGTPNFVDLFYLHSTHRIDDETRHHLTRPKPACTPLFYDLPKVHKPNIPLRPIV